MIWWIKCKLFYFKKCSTLGLWGGLTLEILVLRKLLKEGTGVPLFERSEFGYGYLFLMIFSQNIYSLEFLFLFFQEKRKDTQ